ncbi:MAG: serine/threonine protein phosphatase, partial [Clostridiales bacterium]|nr:serine/threonine protein phosphatase [Clostridiales bacterium]
PVKHPDFTLLSALSPEPGCVYGTSLLSGLPFVSSVLMKIFNTIGTNWERVGNVRFAITYKPQNDALDRNYARERATQIASEWSQAMQSGSSVKDFVAVGDVSIKVIGAENQIPDSEIPVRQMLEQIVAKTGLPPFMLGLSWSSTERMSVQQADILTSELEGYRRILTPVIERICRTFLQLEGYTCTPEIVWNDITLRDEVELARARLYNAQAARLEDTEA